MTTSSAGQPIKTEYVLDNAWQGARERLRLLAEREAFHTLLDDPALLYMGPILMAAWGCKPRA